MKAEPMDCWRVEHWAAVTALRLVLLRDGVMGCNWVTPTDSQTVSLTVSLRGRWTVPLTVSLRACWRVAMRGYWMEEHWVGLKAFLMETRFGSQRENLMVMMTDSCWDWPLDLPTGN